ncbi:MAG: MarR family transcriptional regulator [Pleurocapsa sp. SU_196_0]|nr:MarR family transcriptional regulator [Pleurocapsa sp. SU_196_0]
MPVVDDFSLEELDVMRGVSGLPIDELSLAVASNLWRAAQLFKLKTEREVLREHDLSFASFSTLFIVWIWGPIETRDIARSQSVSKATITSLVSGLEKRALLKRRAHKTDRRLVIVELTAQGKTLIEWVFPRFNQGESEIANTLTVAEQDTLTHLLRKLVAGIHAQLETSNPASPSSQPEETP